FFAQNQREKALGEFNRAIELDPKRVDSYLSLARFYMVTDDRAKADETFQRVLSVNGNSAAARSEYGRYLMMTNRLPEAEAELAKAVELEPTNRNSRFALGSFYLINKRLDKAEEAFKALADLDKDKPDSQAMLADFYSSINRHDEAVRIYQDILAKSPDYVQGRYRLGEILLMRGDSQGASAQIEEALKKDPRDRQALLLRARMRAQTGQTNDLRAALEDLKEVLKQEPNSKIGLYYMAQTNFTLGLLDQARVFAGELERNHADYLPAKLLQVQINLASKDPKGGLRLSSELLDRLSKTAPDREHSPQLLAELIAKTRLARGVAHAQLGSYASAKEEFAAAREIAPKYPDVYINLANIAILENKIDEAVGFFENALSISATDFNALSGLINLYAGSKELDKAHARIDQVMASYPNDAPLHFLKAQVYGFEKNANGAESELRKALELDSNYLAAYSALGALFINTKQEDRAIAEYKRIVDLRPDNASAYTVIGMLYDARKDYDSAADNYRKALEQDPNSVIAANNLAWLYAVHGKGNLDEAVRLAQGVVQRNPQVAGFLDTLGWVYYKKGLSGVAVEQLQKAVSIDETTANKANTSPSPTYRYHLAMALKAGGDTAGAKRELEVALRLANKVPFPDADEARKALATL
ncbi:MAG: tetratricopeptide repeat protein, partial [Pyrinomonadaceae bacterium]